MEIQIYEDERLDDIGFGQLRLIQSPNEFCYGVDAVILADFVKVARGSRVIDLGTGTGILPIILSHKTQAAELWGVELQETSYKKACRNVEINHLSGRIQLLWEDVANLHMPGVFDAVVTNPPYVKKGGGMVNHSEAKHIARHETSATLEAFVSSASNLLKDGGDFFMVHRPDRLVDICCLCRQYSLEPKELRFVSPDRETKPNILLVHGVKGGRPELRMLNPLYVYESRGNYTEELLKIYER